MFSFRSILVAAAAFATVVSSVPTPDVGSSLVRRTFSIGTPIGGIPGVGGVIGGSTNAKRGGPTCYELVKKCHDDIAVIVIKIG